MLTKEECKEGLMYMCNQCIDGTGDYTDCYKVCDGRDILKQLINEHFELLKAYDKACEILHEYGCPNEIYAYCNQCCSIYGDDECWKEYLLNEVNEDVD